MITIVVICGLPGTGKTTIAGAITYIHKLRAITEIPRGLLLDLAFSCFCSRLFDLK